MIIEGTNDIKNNIDHPPIDSTSLSHAILDPKYFPKIVNEIITVGIIKPFNILDRKLNDFLKYMYAKK